MSTIRNASSIPINVQTGTIPNVGGAMRNWFQPMVFSRVFKETVGFQVVESASPVDFHGVIQPLTERRLALKPEGQRAWTWLWLHADPVLTLEVDEVVTYLGVQTRVMARTDYALYGYISYELVQDWTGSGPSIDNVTDFDGGDAFTEVYDESLDGGSALITGMEVNGGDAFAS